MQEMTAKAVTDTPRLNKYLIAAITLAVVLLMGFLAYRVQQKSEASLPSPEITPISLTTLEEQYGIQVYLVAVTAAGGLVDVRLKFVDGEKAKSLLQDSKILPTLGVADSSLTLRTSEDIQTPEIKFEDNGNLFLMYPNIGNVVKPGTPVTIVFGDLQVEPIPAQ